MDTHPLGEAVALGIVVALFAGLSWLWLRIDERRRRLRLNQLFDTGEIYRQASANPPRVVPGPGREALTRGRR